MVYSTRATVEYHAMWCICWISRVQVGQVRG
jgi:hypothetical protein